MQLRTCHTSRPLEVVLNSCNSQALHSMCSSGSQPQTVLLMARGYSAHKWWLQHLLAQCQSMAHTLGLRRERTRAPPFPCTAQPSGTVASVTALTPPAPAAAPLQWLAGKLQILGGSFRQGRSRSSSMDRRDNPPHSRRNSLPQLPRRRRHSLWLLLQSRGDSLPQLLQSRSSRASRRRSRGSRASPELT